MEKAIFLWRPPHLMTNVASQQQLSNYRFGVLKPSLNFMPSGLVIKRSALLCSRLSAWEPSPLPYSDRSDVDSTIKESNIFESLDVQEASTTSISEGENSTTSQEKSLQPLRWPMWLLGPSVLLVTGMVPTLWLPLSSVFLGCNISSLLSLVGLDCIFNIGATLFLLMADACARSNLKSAGSNLKREPHTPTDLIPWNYRFCNASAGLAGFIIPLMILLASHRSILHPPLQSLSFAVLFGPYLLLLFMQMLTEMLTWHWRSPVWLIAPIVYEAYRVLQLMRGLRLAGEVAAPPWVVHSIRGLVSWWILILGIQLMRVSWFAGFHARADPSVDQ
uniref:Uncharacterized protein n=2 Tax=Nymphaea colorata TaxID=210225 RepID=A0A5K0YL77_9MAGN|nr:unnamed protein product [Nymphaea colorata]